MQDFEQSVIYRERRYWTNGKGWCTWFEPCPIVRHTPKVITIESQDFPGSKLYPGGKFNLKRSELIEKSCAYHSRHGEYFWMEKPCQGDLFPSADVLNMPTAIDLEAASMGWDLKNLSNQQFMAYMLALRSGISLKIAMSEV